MTEQLQKLRLALYDEKVTEVTYTKEKCRQKDLNACLNMRTRRKAFFDYSLKKHWKQTRANGFKQLDPERKTLAFFPLPFTKSKQGQQHYM